ncbi:MAG: RNA pseudouridine synthase [Clostridiales bacterium]|nr:RNA pseudouridine synthase [Clostridiales bacterium]
MINLSVLYEDESLIVCKKPSGVATQTKRIGQADMESLLKNYRMGRGEEPYIGIVHRLDQPVEGIMVFSKTKEAAAALSRQIAAGKVDKFYYAMVEGVPPKKKATLCDYLLRDGRTNISAVVASGTADAKRAVLAYELLEENGKRAVLRIRLETGRHHQIRVQLSHAGYPIVGDRKYNFRENLSSSGEALALCSYKIVFRHPKTLKKLELEIDKPYHLS